VTPVTGVDHHDVYFGVGNRGSFDGPKRPVIDDSEAT
jgi:hypothetical protein